MKKKKTGGDKSRFGVNSMFLDGGMEFCKKYKNPARKSIASILNETENMRAVQLAKEGIKRDFPKDAEKAIMAMDEAIKASADQLILQGGLYGGFIGWQMLATLTQDPTINVSTQIYSNEMTRKWIKLSSYGTEDRSEQITKIEQEMERLGVKAILRDACTVTDQFGGCKIYVGLKNLPDVDPNEENKKPLYLDSRKIPIGSLKYFQVIEPFTCVPSPYNTIYPLRPDFYVPESWYVYGNMVHSSRLLHMDTGRLPFMIRPIYMFYGISLTQLIYDRVYDFNRARMASAEMCVSYSMTGLKSNMTNLLSSNGDAKDGEGFISRIQLIADLRNNSNIVAIDKDQEEFFQLNAPIGGIEDLVKLQLEMIAVIMKVPNVKFLGDSPKGMNATGELDQDMWADTIKELQEYRLRPVLEKIIKIIQLSVFGEIYEDITFDFLSIEEESEQQKAERRKLNVDCLTSLVMTNIISTEDARKSLASDKESTLSLNVEEDDDEPMDDLDIDMTSDEPIRND